MFDEGGGFWSVARTLIALIGVCALAWISLSWMSRRGFGGAPRADARLKLLAQLALGPRRQVFLVQADTRVFLLGAGETGGVALIAELEPEPRPAPPPSEPAG